MWCFPYIYWERFESSPIIIPTKKSIHCYWCWVAALQSFLFRHFGPLGPQGVCCRSRWSGRRDRHRCWGSRGLRLGLLLLRLLSGRVWSGGHCRVWCCLKTQRMIPGRIPDRVDVPVNSLEVWHVRVGGGRSGLPSARAVGDHWRRSDYSRLRSLGH